MKEIYDYINSKAIREHCKAIGHEFNAMESAFLIYQSKNHTLQEKHLAWEHIIQTMDDTQIAERLNCPYIPSLHGFLRKYMDIQKAVLDRFFAKEAGYIYSFAPLLRSEYYGDGQYHGYEYDDMDNLRVYGEYGAGLAAEMNRLDENLDESERQLLLGFSVTRTRILTGPEDEEENIRVTVDERGRALQLDEGSRYGMIRENFDLLFAFEGMWIDIPTPFKKGDIVFIDREKEGFPVTPFVMSDLCTDRETEADKRIYDRLAEQGDISDMTVGGYWLSGDGKYVYREVEHSYQDMEYYRGPAGGRQGDIFYHISLYLRGKMDPLDMMINYDRIMKG